jgi:plasmid stabilization system protein ParE
VRTTAVSEQHISAIDLWWRSNRPKAPDLFLDELADTLALIEAAPSLGRPWIETDVPGVRRVVMRACRYHVYYREDEDGIVVLAVWSAVRGRGPQL